MSQEAKRRRIPIYDNRRVHRQCSRKKGYTTTKDVNRQIHKTMRATGLKLNYYKCEICGKYHLTKKFVKSKF